VGETTLILDLDPQGNASTGLGIAQSERRISSYDVLMGTAPLKAAILPTLIPGLHIVPSTMDLSGAEVELIELERRAHRLADAIEHYLSETEGAQTTPRPRYVLIDCPPALNLLTVNALAAAHAVLVPLQCEFFALEGLTQLLKTVRRVQATLNPSLDIQGVVLTMYDTRNRLSDQVATDVRSYLGDKVYKTIIPRNVRLSEAPSHGKPALVYDHRCAGSQAYMRLASEILQQMRATGAG
jgi:chromosome partitioning protein